jgi:hypothetical protein
MLRSLKLEVSTQLWAKITHKKSSGELNATNYYSIIKNDFLMQQKH